MEVFPNLSKNQVAVLISKSETGVVLNTDLEIFNENLNNDNVYHVYNDIDDAYSFISELKKKDSLLEFVIYGNDKSVIKYIE